MINKKVSSYYQNNDNITSSNDTYVVGLRHEADTINNLICGFLPVFEDSISSESFISTATD